MLGHITILDTLVIHIIVLTLMLTNKCRVYLKEEKRDMSGRKRGTYDDIIHVLHLILLSLERIFFLNIKSLVIMELL